MNEEELQKIRMTNEELGREELLRIERDVADIQRFLQIVTLIPGAQELALNDHEGFRREYGLETVDLDEMRYFIDEELIRSLLPLSPEEQVAALPERVFRYKQYLSNKLLSRDKMLFESCVPSNPRMKIWRERQIERCKGFSGQAYSGNIHTPFVVELSDGCSVGCPFCAAGAKRLQKVFRHTEENAKLFEDVLLAAKELLGDCIGSGGLYYATEPLDNPDLELFAEDFYRIGGMFPQFTTAVPLRNPERMHKILARVRTVPETIHRFSVHTLEDTRRILAEFTPLELLRTELLGEYEEAPCFEGFANAGKARANGKGRTDADAGDKISVDSICCVTGFIVNMAAKTVRLITSVNASDRYPNGEILYEIADWETADDLKATMRRMIDTYMQTGCPAELKLHIHDYFTLDTDADGVCALRSRAYQVRLDKLAYWCAEPVVRGILSGDYTANELVHKLNYEQEIDPVKTRWMIALLWRKGLLDELYQA